MSEKEINRLRIINERLRKENNKYKKGIDKLIKIWLKSELIDVNDTIEVIKELKEFNDAGNVQIAEINLEPPFEVGEYTDILLRIYLDKKASDKGEHFGKPFDVARGVSLQMNNSYESFQNRLYWTSGNIWFAPLSIEEIDRGLKE